MRHLEYTDGRLKVQTKASPVREIDDEGDTETGG